MLIIGDFAHKIIKKEKSKEGKLNLKRLSIKQAIQTLFISMKAGRSALQRELILNIYTKYIYTNSVDAHTNGCKKT